jgi:hypothetical protein
LRCTLCWSRVHPALEPAVHGLAEPKDLVHTDLAGAPIPLLPFRAVEDNVEFHEGVTNPLGAEGLKVRVELEDHCLENHDAIGSDALGLDGVCGRALGVRAP